MKQFLIAIGIVLFGFQAFAQVPQGINYQAMARTSDGLILVSKELAVRATIKNQDEVFWQEVQFIKTNQHGMFSMVIGDESAERTGGIAEVFPDVPWEMGNLALNLEIDVGEGYVAIGESALMSVPYALFAGSSPQSNSGWDTDGSGLHTSQMVEIIGKEAQDGNPLFVVKNSIGIPVFAVYNDGVMVCVDDYRKGIKGGFAIGGYNSQNKEITQEYMRVTPDSVRINIPDASGKGIKGGFAIGGYNSAKKAKGSQYFSVSSEGSNFIGSVNVEGDLTANAIIDTIGKKSIQAGEVNSELLLTLKSELKEQESDNSRELENEQLTLILIQTLMEQQKQIEELQGIVLTNTLLEQRVAELEAKLLNRKDVYSEK